MTRRLATAIRSRVSIRGQRVKICLTSSLIAMENSIVVSHTVCAHVGGPKKVAGRLGPHLGMGAWVSP